ncbi:HAD family phosphatase [Candidatus Woesearchaeota archaeon]|nr:HAD family phosphatase [Candidatus Woesearchaeota archaeon]
MIKVIIFDIGGVLINVNKELRCEKLQKYSKLSKKEIHGIVFDKKNGLSNKFNEGKMSSYKFYESLCNKVDSKISYEKFKSLWNIAEITDKKINNLILKLKKNDYRLIILSNINDLHFNYISKKYKNLIKNFDDFILSYKIGVRKPNDGIYKEAIKLSGCDPSQIVFIDDEKSNVMAAQKLGINIIQFKSVAQLEKDLLKLGVVL